MMNKEDLINQLKGKYDSLTESQKLLVEYILDNFEDVAFMSALELGDKIGVSDATIIRFTKSIGFEGFVDFRNAIRMTMGTQISPDERLIRSWDKNNNNGKNIMKMAKLDLKNLENFILNMDSNNINRAVDEMLLAEKIFLVGLGSSEIVTQLLSWHLRRMGFNIVNIKEGGIILMDILNTITKKDLLIVCSFPRYSKDIMNAIKLAKNKGAKIVSITDTESSKISINSDIVLLTQVDNISFFNSYVVPMEMCNVLIMNILERDKGKIYNKLKENSSVLEEFQLYF